MLSAVVTDYLEKNIPHEIEKLDPEEGNPFLLIKAKSPDFGDIQLFDDGDEVTIWFGKFTHSHFSNYDDISVEEKELQIAKDVYQILKQTLADELEFWVSKVGGGFHGAQKESVYYPTNKFLGRIFNRKPRVYYRWSGSKRTDVS